MPIPESTHSQLLSVLSYGTLLESTVMVSVFLGALFIGSVLLPGRQITGLDRDGKTHHYRLNGFALFLLTVAVLGFAQIFGWFSLSVLYTHFAPLFVIANLLAFVFSGWLYYQATRTRTAQASPGILRGGFFGLECNPTLLGVDLKLFSYRPSLIALVLFSASFAVTQFEIYGSLSLAMMLYQVFIFLYVLNYFHFEYGMTHTWDMVSERFGWMLVWGDYVLVPFFYCLPGWWLVHPSQPLSLIATVSIIVLFIFGFWLFRGANEQKHRFKCDPGAIIWGQPARTLDGRLLISGFWGIGRHLNYTGEICIYLAFALTTGFESWIPYLLPIWLMTLLWHRSRRDDHRCRAKYGQLWEHYTRRVRYSLLPFIY